MYAIRNEGKRSYGLAVHEKKAGLKKAVPDICLPIPKGQFGALYIEMKSAKGKLSIEQQEYLRLLTKFGNRCVVCYNSDDAIDAIIEYLKI